MKKLFLILAIAAILPACTWVTLTKEGEKVRVLSDAEVGNCKKLGNTTATVKNTVVGFERNEKKMTKELEDLARNAAVNLNGDTVVPSSGIKDGKQTFDIYRCVNP
ncbi:MAG: DUF4156 domain-containing protein [Gammaproteobacteria bacterium]|nr:DUF4156 domain-containing protein [Gammaproteobacteria bacterium]MDH5651646.1 DUF4156 domain-containing protein [Gammaproteobacteria bacterium]